ncbi:MAG: 4Fe-4S binding protein [Eubacteriales bacterium]|nr:4Fe-4S binding protein [Eubacteriales bacterium]
MIRKIIHIDEEKCNGCGACAAACHEGAIGMVAGKAKLLRDDYCDGLGDCLPACPTGAITFTEREAAPYDQAAVAAHQAVKPLACGCPGTQSRSLAPAGIPAAAPADTPRVSQLGQWPVQIKLAPVNAPYFRNARLLVAASCSAFSYGDFHERFIKNHVTLIGCPKLDGGDYAEKLTTILQQNDIRSVTVVRMEVPCCGGLTRAVTAALQASGKMIPWQVVTISTDGRILE